MMEEFRKITAEASTMIEGKPGDRLLVESEKVGRPGREGEILEVLTGAAGCYYRVRWEDGHETTFFPSGGSASIIEAAGRGKAARK